MSALGRGFGDLIPTDVNQLYDPTAKQDEKLSR